MCAACLYIIYNYMTSLCIYLISHIPRLSSFFQHDKEMRRSEKAGRPGVEVLCVA